MFTAIILILSLMINLFICIYTLSHPKSLEKSSTMFLFNLALVSLLMTVLFMPFMVVASAAEEWIIGQSDSERDVLCQITAFIFAYTMAAISFHLIGSCLRFVAFMHGGKTPRCRDFLLTTTMSEPITLPLAYACISYYSKHTSVVLLFGHTQPQRWLESSSLNKDLLQEKGPFRTKVNIHYLTLNLLEN